MKKLLLSFSLLFSVCSFATHNKAGNISYTYMGTMTNPYQYEIIVTTYTKWVGTSGTDKCELTVNFGDGASAIAPRVNGPTTNCPSTADGVLITSSVRKNIYSTQHNYSGPGTYRITMEDPNRSSGICNVYDSDNVSYYFEAELIISPFLGNNTAPVYTATPVIDVGVGVIGNYNPLVTEPDGDSLYYELVTPMAGGTYLSGYTLPHATSSFTLNNNTGEITWDTPEWLCVYIFDIRIFEFRKIGGSYYPIGNTMQEVWAEVKPFVGIEDDQNETALSLFPNPSNGELNLSIENAVQGENYEVVICNSLGQKVKTLNLQNSSAKLNEGELPAGIYFYSLQGDGRILSKGKFVILEGFVK